MDLVPRSLVRWRDAQQESLLNRGPYFDVLGAAKIDDQKKLDWAKHTLSLRERHLESADFSFADLRKADLERAHLQGAKLDNAHLQGASLVGVELQGANLDGALLQGANLDSANLQGASLNGAHLQGASLYGAELQGAKLDGAQLQGANLDSADLQGASLNGADLQGASLEHTKLQGASLTRVPLQGARLKNVFVWRADARTADFHDAFVSDPDPEARQKPEFAALKQLIGDQLQTSNFRLAETSGYRLAALQRIERLDPDKTLEGEAEMAQVWDRATTPALEGAFDKARAEQWHRMVPSYAGNWVTG
jgi:uncharacterized protein YjbI with pentapeptide repeats